MLRRRTLRLRTLRRPMTSRRSMRITTAPSTGTNSLPPARRDSCACRRHLTAEDALVMRAFGALCQYPTFGLTLASQRWARRASERLSSSKPQVLAAQLLDRAATHQLHVAFDFAAEVS